MLAGHTASGTIEPSRFVKLSGSYLVAVCGAGEVPIGISQEGSALPPIPGAATAAAVAGDPLRVYGDTENCLLEAGAAVADGAYLKSDSTGRGVTSPTTEKYFAIAERGAAAAGEKMQVILIRGTVP